MNGPCIRYRFASELPHKRNSAYPPLRLIYTDSAAGITGFELRRKICDKMGMPCERPRRPQFHRVQVYPEGHIHMFYSGECCGEAVGDNDLVSSYTSIVVKRHPQPWDQVENHALLKGGTPPSHHVASKTCNMKGI